MSNQNQENTNNTNQDNKENNTFLDKVISFFKKVWHYIYIGLVSIGRFFKKTYKLILNIVLYSILLLLFLFSIANLTLKDKASIPNIFGLGFLNVLSDSMTGPEKDSFNKGDLIIVHVFKDKESRNTLKVGDVVTWFDPGKGFLNSHRIIEIGDGVYLTKGDNTTGVDLFVPSAEQIRGKYLGKIPNLGTAIGYMRTPIGFGLTIFLPVLLFLIFQASILIKNLLLLNKEKVKASNEIDKDELRRQLKAELEQQLKEELLLEEKLKAEKENKE
jgi:signal peptidase